MDYIERPTYKGATEILLCRREAPHPQAEFAMALMGNLAIVACSLGTSVDATVNERRLFTEEEIVARACKIADLTWKEFRARGWLLDIPLPKTENKE